MKYAIESFLLHITVLTLLSVSTPYDSSMPNISPFPKIATLILLTLGSYLSFVCFLSTNFYPIVISVYLAHAI